MRRNGRNRRSVTQRRFCDIVAVEHLVEVSVDLDHVSSFKARASSNSLRQGGGGRCLTQFRLQRTVVLFL